jgi:hypothetical protein
VCGDFTGARHLKKVPWPYAQELRRDKLINKSLWAAKDLFRPLKALHTTTYPAKDEDASRTICEFAAALSIKTVG